MVLAKKISYKMEIPSLKSILNELKLFGVNGNQSNKFFNDFSDKLLVNKDPNWAFEMEHRMLYKNPGKNILTPNFEMTSITFGLKMPDNNKLDIINRLKDRNISFFQAKQKIDSYELEIIPY